MKSCSRIAQQGFSLLEILIAFSILALALGILLNIFASGLQRAVIAEDYQQAVVIAQSKLVVMGLEQPLQEGTLDGYIDDKYHWLITVQAFDMSANGLAPESLIAQPYQVTVNVSWPAGQHNRELELTTLKLAKLAI